MIYRLAKYGSGVGAGTLPQKYKTRKEAEKALIAHKSGFNYHIIEVEEKN